MKPGGGKQKGAQFERDVCKKLSLWVTQGKRDDVFWRSAMSGGRATIGQQQGVVRHHQFGDVSAIAKEGHALTNTFIIECKYYRDFQWAAYMLRRSGILHEMWMKLCQQAFDPNVDRIPMLIGRQNRYQPFIMLPPFEALPETRLAFKEENFDLKVSNIITSLDDLIEQVDAKDLIGVYQKGLYKNFIGN